LRLLQVGRAADNEVDMSAEVVQDAVSGSWHGRLHVSFQQTSAGQHTCHDFQQTHLQSVYVKAHVVLMSRKQCVCQNACK